MGILSLLCHWERMKHLDGVWIRAQVGSIGPFTGERNGFLAAFSLWPSEEKIKEGHRSNGRRA